ncbi:hypothetical protein FEK33_24475 [Nocardia asteroides NBRC 15531]|nr:hypothetical protein [Nocardia asteroides]TLF63224.1 hypothetical protein FEK33_24475 [Nocardia asteroides NBRC 15531]UGT47373.1 hypothetical protein LT345_23070 [Nocardia asteroides]SFN78872.1 hypothetical protein SAMN05444423_11419 [Nocardia asteroides]VEG33731.1 Uncharacterised protein [Nocardia asteroides]
MNGRAVVSVAVGLLCGYLAGYVIGHTRTDFAVVVHDGRASWFGAGPGSAAVIAAVVATAVVVVLGRFRARYLVAVAAGLAGLAMVVAIAALQSAGTDSEQWVLGSIGAGLLIAAAVLRPAGQTWFVVGSMVSVLYGARIDESVELPRRYADYLTTRTVPDLPGSWPLLVAAVIALLAAGFVVGRERIETASPGRAVAVGAGIPLAIGALIWLVGQVPGNPSVIVAVVVVLGTAAVSLWLPAADAIYTLTMLAVAAAIAVDPSVGVGPDRVGLSVQIALLALGALVGTLRRLPLVGIGLCALVTLGGLVPTLIDSTTVTEVAFRFVLPAAVGFAVGACLPVAPTTVVALSVFPVVARLFENGRATWSAGDELGWTAYAPDAYTVGRPGAAPMLAATVVILGCAILVWSRQRVRTYPSRPPNMPPD